MQPLGTGRDQTPSGGQAGTGGLGSRSTGGGKRPRSWSPALTFLLVVVLAAAAYLERISAAGAIAAAVFGGAALFFAERLVGSLDGGERASFESAWGGLGGGLGGWRLTTPLVYLVATAVFGTLLMVVAVQEMPPRAGEAAATDEAEQGGEAPAGEDEADGENGDATEPAGADDADEPEGEGEDASEGAGTEPGDDEASDALATGAAAAGTEGAPAAQP